MVKKPIFAHPNGEYCSLVVDFHCEPGVIKKNPAVVLDSFEKKIPP
jgi:hypothetical protein